MAGHRGRGAGRHGGAGGARLLLAAALVAGTVAGGAAAAPPASSAPPASPGSGSPIVLRDDRGTEHRLAQPVRRIVSMLPSLTEIVAEVQARSDAPGRLVGVDRHSNWPSTVLRLPRTGDMEAVAVETIVSLRPDVVLASTSSRGLDRLEALGLRVVRLQSDRHADVQRALEAVARLMGDPAAGARAWADLQQQLDAAAARVPAGWRGRSVYLEIGAGPHAAGAASFIGETVSRLGLVNVVGPELGPFPRLNPEFVLQAAPDLVIGARREVDAMSGRPGWHTLRALREGRRCALAPEDYERMIRPGPRLGETARVLADCIAALPPPR